MTDPVHMIIAGGFFVVALVVGIDHLDRWWRFRKARKLRDNLFRIKSKRRLFRDMPMASRRDK